MKSNYQHEAELLNDNIHKEERNCQNFNGVNFSMFASI